MTDLKPGVCDAPLARLRGLTSATSRESGLTCRRRFEALIEQGRDSGLSDEVIIAGLLAAAEALAEGLS